MSENARFAARKIVEGLRGLADELDARLDGPPQDGERLQDPGVGPTKAAILDMLEYEERIARYTMENAGDQLQVVYARGALSVVQWITSRIEEM